MGANQIMLSWPLLAVAAEWTKQLVDQVKVLHAEGISHLCLGPPNVSVDAAGILHVGDFLGKIRVLRLLESGWQGMLGVLDGNWAMWYPPEVHFRLSGTDAGTDRLSEGSCLDGFRVDSWQLGVM